MKEIDRSGQGREIQPLISSVLVTVGTFKIALIRQDDANTLELHLLDGAFPEKTRV
jgi:hypothetical protein